MKSAMSFPLIYMARVFAMLVCGRDWQPKAIKRVIEPIPSSTKVAKVGTDAGNGFLKGMGNPAGSMSLITELVAGELAVWFGLKIPSFAVVQVNNIDIPMIGHGIMSYGPAFISKEIQCFTFDSSAEILGRVSNKEDITRLVVFDTWIRNYDRSPPPETGYNYNFDNVIFTQNGSSLEMYIIDHSHCFAETTLEAEIECNALLIDDMVYGLFPEFKPFINERTVRECVTRLGQIDTKTVEEIVNSVPQNWGLAARYKSAWAGQICKRAKIVANYLPARLIDQPSLEFGG
jgi:hypothetical protein